MAVILSIAHSFKRTTPELHAFSARLGETVDEAAVRRALTERSFVLQRRLERERSAESTEDNSALAVRGRELMTSYVAGWLRAALPRVPEEGVQAVTSYLTSRSQLHDLASGIGLKDIVLSEEYPPSEEALVRCLCAWLAALANSAGEQRAHLPELTELSDDKLLEELTEQRVYYYSRAILGTRTLMAL
ncbi:39S ribosomal protein L44, mitochondrial-like [Pollicipes pollicipes]|uniref:39S ribosomal protein L44, mitochondrial-like n=1 Tax=Pollicipes pollicipes TaxID=41117 RepID=UPI001884E4C0|nr:39S ribosomal protein L44, mitochondrial-like [Pollicipes pollicipes]